MHIVIKLIKHYMHEHRRWDISQPNCQQNYSTRFDTGRYLDSWESTDLDATKAKQKPDGITTPEPATATLTKPCVTACVHMGLLRLGLARS